MNCERRVPALSHRCSAAALAETAGSRRGPAGADGGPGAAGAAAASPPVYCAGSGSVGGAGRRSRFACFACFAFRTAGLGIAGGRAIGCGAAGIGTGTCLVY